MVRNLALPSSAAVLCLMSAGCGPDSALRDDPSESALVLPSSGPTASDDDPCGAKQLAALVHRRDSAGTRASVARFAGNAPVRWIEPGMAVTADYSAERLNVILDEDGRIATLRCG